MDTLWGFVKTGFYGLAGFGVVGFSVYYVVIYWLNAWDMGLGQLDLNDWIKLVFVTLFFGFIAFVFFIMTVVTVRDGFTVSSLPGLRDPGLV